MPQTAEDILASRKPTAERPLLGQTVLVVEDSRFACEAMRLLCLRSGARIRRADCLRAAARHLAVYRPSIAVVDLGLPDGSGLQLVRDLSRTSPRVPVILATSGDDLLRGEALDAGADDFLPKPTNSIAAFQAAVLAHLPPESRPNGPRPVQMGKVSPDALALRDDLQHVAELLSREPDDDTLDYLTQFLGGIARSAGDSALAEAASDLSFSRRGGGAVERLVSELQSMIAGRLADKAVV